MWDQNKIRALLAVIAVLLCVGFVFSVKITENIDHSAQAEALPVHARG
jgi:uncharacterized membrane protein YqjE